MSLTPAPDLENFLVDNGLFVAGTTNISTARMQADSRGLLPNMWDRTTGGRFVHDPGTVSVWKLPEGGDDVQAVDGVLFEISNKTWMQKLAEHHVGV
jgi:hypothetical protein